jgi:hypothetical protein
MIEMRQKDMAAGMEISRQTASKELKVWDELHEFFEQRAHKQLNAIAVVFWGAIDHLPRTEWLCTFRTVEPESTSGFLSTNEREGIPVE